jgi:hypothetical protein
VLFKVNPSSQRAEASTTIAASATAGRILPAMLPSHGYQGFLAAPIPSGWVQMGESWVLWWNGRQIANVRCGKDGVVRVHLDARKMWKTKDVPAASIAQGKRYAERWCAVRLYPEIRLRAAVARLLDTTPSEPLEPLSGLPPTREQQQQARRLAEATAIATAVVKEALEPAKPPVAQLQPKDARKAWVRGGLERLRRGI